MNKALDLLLRNELTHLDFVVIAYLMANTIRWNVIVNSKAEIAKKIGCSRQAVNSSFKRLTKHRLIATDLEGKLCLSSLLVWQGKQSDRFWPFKGENNKGENNK